MKLRSYEKVWKIENKIYSFQNFRLPIPIALSALAYFSLTCAIIFTLGRILPITAKIPSVLRFGVLPYFATEFLRKKKLDGKPPHIFARDYIAFLLTKNTNIEFFRVPERQGSDIIKLNWSCTTRNT